MSPDVPQSDGAGDGGKFDSIPTTPPAAVQAEIDRAAERVAELRAERRSLHFVCDEASGRVQVEVRDLNGSLIRVIPPSKALSVIAGGTLD